MLIQPEGSDARIRLESDDENVAQIRAQVLVHQGACKATDVDPGQVATIAQSSPCLITEIPRP
jgi:hypothetical protein